MSLTGSGRVGNRYRGTLAKDFDAFRLWFSGLLVTTFWAQNRRLWPAVKGFAPAMMAADWLNLLPVLTQVNSDGSRHRARPTNLGHRPNGFHRCRLEAAFVVFPFWPLPRASKRISAHNLSFGGEVTFERKHTAGMLRDLSWMISETVATLPVRFAAQSVTFETYKRRELSDKDVHDLVVRLWEADAIGLLEIPKLIEEWRAPRHPEFAQAGKTAWRLFNAATETVKGDLWRLPARTQAMHAVIDETCDIPATRNGSEHDFGTVSVPHEP